MEYTWSVCVFIIYNNGKHCRFVFYFIQTHTILIKAHDVHVSYNNITCGGAVAAASCVYHFKLFVH